MPTTLPQTYIHPTPLTTLAPHLLPHLPESLPLLRRLQFHTSSPSARTIATFPPSPPPPRTTTTTTTTTPPSSFAATWADRARSPETECWIFSTHETLPLLPAPTPSQRQEAQAQCLALLAGLARLPAPASGTPLVVVGSVNERVLVLMGGEEVVGGLLVPEAVVSRDPRRGGGGGGDDGADRGRGRGVISGISVPYCKWLIPPPAGGAEAREEGGRVTRSSPRKEEEEEGIKYNSGNPSSSSSSLPSDYAFGTVRRDELALTMSRTQIPQTEDTLARLGSVGVRYTGPAGSTSNSTSTTTSASRIAAAEGGNDAERGELVAWAFLGVDGSLKSLHVEAEHRGQGLAKAVSRRLFRSLGDDALAMGFRAVDHDDNDDDGARREGVGGFNGRGEGWAHSDVAEGNVESAGVARGLGGKEGWRVRWVSVDLAAAVER